MAFHKDLKLLMMKHISVIDTIMFRFLMSLPANENLEIRLIDVDSEYLYESLYTDIYIRVPDELKMPKALNLNLKIYVQQNCKDHYID